MDWFVFTHFQNLYRSAHTQGIGNRMPMESHVALIFIARYLSQLILVSQWVGPPLSFKDDGWSNVGSTHTNKKHTPSIRMTMHRQSPFIHQQHSWMNEAKFQTSTWMRKERGWRCEWEMWWKGVRHEMKWHWWIRNQIECGFQSWIWRFRFYMSDSPLSLFFFLGGGMPAARPSVFATAHHYHPIYE